MTGERTRSISNRLAPPGFLLFAGVLIAGIAASVAVRGGWDWQGPLIGFDLAALVFLVAKARLLGDRPHQMRAQAARNDANRAGLLLLAVVIVLVILVTVGSVIAAPGGLARLDVILIVATLALAWLFANIVFALHYAHLFYLPAGSGDHRGLEVPGATEPGYWDFLYFALTLGMTFQTSDVTITGPRMRRAVLLHCLAAFIFNMGVLAFTVNALGGLS